MNIKINQRLVCLMTMVPVFAFLGCSNKLHERIRLIEHAFDYNNINRTLTAVYTDDVRFELGTIILEGKKAMQIAAGWDSVVNSHFSYSNFRMIGDTVICKCTEENDLDKLLGIEHGYFDPVTFVFDGSRIKYVKFQRTAENRRVSNTAWGPFMEWASKERGQDLAELMPDGKFVVNAQTAQGWLALAKEWRKVTNPK